MNVAEMDLPQTIKDCLDAQVDITFDSYSDKGQNGFVVFGIHNILKQPVALKFYYFSEGEHKEVQLLATFNHPNILDVLDARTVDNGLAYFMTPAIKLGDLDQHIQAGSLSLKDAIIITRGVLDGVGAMHNPPYHILHRDLKPENILLKGMQTPLIADFGSVKGVPEGAKFVSGSQHASLYRPPESYDPGFYTYSSDIYQIGLVFFQLAGGYLPYEAEKWFTQGEGKVYKALSDPYEKSKYIDEVLYKRSRAGRLARMDTLPLYVPSGVKSIMKKSTHPDHAKRYQSTAEFHLALHGLGEIPEWKTLDGLHHLINWKGKDYRIVPRGITYVCEKKGCNAMIWRKDSAISVGSAEDVMCQIIDTLGIQ